MKLGIVFPGQGSQISEMGQDLCRSFQIARKLYDRANAVLGYDLLKACENHNHELNDTTIVQPAILVHSVVCWHIFQQLTEQVPVVMTGHSLGELSAVVCSGGITFEKAVALVKMRAELMANCETDGGMMVLFGLPEAPIRRICAELSKTGHLVDIANHNTAEQWVLSGHRTALQVAAVRLEQQGGVTKHLNVSIAAHSLLMQPALLPFEEAIRQADPQDLQVPVLSCSSGTLYKKKEEVAPMLSRQLVECVNWPLTMTRLIEMGVDTVVELGPKTVLRDFIRLEFPKLRTVSLGMIEDTGVIQRLLTVGTLGGQVVDEALIGSQVEGFLQACLRLAIGTPTLKMHSPTSFEQTIRVPYRALVSDLDAVRAAGEVQLDSSVLRRAAEYTLRLLRAKGLDSKFSIALLGQIATSYVVQDTIAEYLV